MSRWEWCVVSKEGTRLNEPEEDGTISGWHWAGTKDAPKLVADFEKSTVVISELGFAYAFRIWRVDRPDLQFHAVWWNGEIQVEPGAEVHNGGIEIEAGCVALLEEYLPLMPEGWRT